MATNVKHSLVYLRFSTVSVAAALDDATAKLLLCEVDSSWDSTASVSEVETKTCGTFKVAGSPGNTLSGNGVVVGDLGSNEVSSQQALIWLNAQTTLYFAYKNDTDGGTLAANEVVYRTGNGYFSKVSETFNTGDKMGKFSWEFAVNGAVDFTP
jgi:hypothetical protein